MILICVPIPSTNGSFQETLLATKRFDVFVVYSKKGFCVKIIDDKSQFAEESMKYKGTLVVVKDCDHALKFYHDMFGLQLLQDNDGNMKLTGGLYLQEAEYWEKYIDKSITPRSFTYCNE